jgi:hypothetical protein
MNFTDYLAGALARALEDERQRLDHGDLEYFNRLCRQGVYKNWSALDPKLFLKNYHRCVAAVAKKVAVVEKNWPKQVALFRHHDPARIVRERDVIWEEWKVDKCYLSPKMVEAVIATAELINCSWDDFKGRYLLLPKNPETESLKDWARAHAALDDLPMVGKATAWYLIRNLYGARVFKPDVHINAIASHFFPNVESPLDAMADAVRVQWKQVCHDDRFPTVHLGVVDYILWWYRAATGLPKIKVAATC